jgi:glutamate dehydrogenase
MIVSWKEQLNKNLLNCFGQRKGELLSKKYSPLFEAAYCNECSPDVALQDITYSETLAADNFLEVYFYFAKDKVDFESGGKTLHLRLYKWEKPIPLSDILPILGDFDFRVWSERSYRFICGKNTVWISDFVLSCGVSGQVQLEKLRPLFRDAFRQRFVGNFESDGLNKLILRAQLSWREITVLRAYAKYLRQVNFRFSQVYVEAALVNNALLTKTLMQLYDSRFNPQKKSGQKNQQLLLENKILQGLDQVTSLDEDLIIRRFLILVKATLRTTYFQHSAADKPQQYLAFKLHSAAIPELPLPVPLYEIFVYSPRFEGIHLRSSHVARGGIRWSDRREDFRSEVLGLMKAQWVKNAIIVPSGAKGGFVLKTLQPAATREETQQEVLACYAGFIRGLLDLTDNIKNGKVVRPPHVLCFDDPDPYLVVAADKGTATFSDLANSLAKEYNFWLGDAFASGGKTGYDHKKMGITARGAWESVKRHFRELDINTEQTVITVVGIGDMSGDVFGNGLIYSKNLKLVAAFDHRHIFLDPDPDPVLSYHERLRLFNLPSSSWEDYNLQLLSKGGAVYKRSVKAISLSPEIKKVLAIEDDSVMPNELIRAILKAPVDLLWNGGIGTYVKASTENHADVGDKTNDLNRVNGNELRCKVVGEGGNLGFTQRGRIEYALNQGIINTDFIDNSAGVDCSDHEVNLKILLSTVVAKGKLTEKNRNQLLMDVTTEIAALVLKDNYLQAWILSFLAKYSYADTLAYQNYIKNLEALGHLNRHAEFLPDDKTIVDRHAAGSGLLRPELAVLLAYTKIYLKKELLKSTFPEDPFFAQMISAEFPVTINKVYHQASEEHSLRREIIATQWANRVVNEMGIVFVYRLQSELGATVADIIRAHAVASSIFEAQKMQAVIEALDFKIPLASQYELLFHLRHLMNISTRWFLLENRLKGAIPKIIEHYSSRLKLLEKLMVELMSGATKVYWENLREQFIKASLTPELASHIASYRVAYTSLNIIEVATLYNFDLIKAAKMYFAVGERFNLVWFRDFIANDMREGAWNILARLTLRDQLDALQKGLTIEMMKNSKKEEDLPKAIEQWKLKNTAALDRWEKMLRALHESSNVDYSMFFIVLRELGNVGFG